MPDYSRPADVILASGSPRRRDLLNRLGIPFTADPGNVAERPPQPDEDPTAYALALAREKCLDGRSRHPDAVVLAADTVVAIEGVILGKPGTPDRALDMLRMLRGRCHTVITAVAVGRGMEEAGDALHSEVWMGRFSDRMLRSYVAGGEPLDKAGAYAVQGDGNQLVTRIVGCYNNIVGLPLCLTSRLLARHIRMEDVSNGIDPHVPDREA